MGIPYYPPKTCKEGSFELGVSLSTFMKLVDAGEIEISYRGGEFPNINNDTLNVYKEKYGGREERYNKYIREKIHEYQEKEILRYSKLIIASLPKKRMNQRVKLRTIDELLIHEIRVNGFDEKEIIKFYELIISVKEDKKVLKELYTMGLSDNILEKYYEDEFFDLSILKNAIKKITLNETIGNMTINSPSYSEFFTAHKSNLRKFKTIKFLKYSQIKNFILEAKQIDYYILKEDIL